MNPRDTEIVIMGAVTLLVMVMVIGFIILAIGKRWGAGRTLAVILCLGVAGIVTLLVKMRPNLDIPSMNVDARDLIQKAGGTDKICDEADQIFKKYGTESRPEFDSDTLSDYPAINSLRGRHCWMEPESASFTGWPGSPAMIKVMAGTHFDGYFIDIVPKDSPYKYQMRSGILVIVKDRIFIHR
jgi:hypothetical protein